MLQRVETTDPITGRDIEDLNGKPFVVERSSEDQLTIYFESEESKRKYMEIPVEHPIEHRLNLDNPTEEGMVDEG